MFCTTSKPLLDHNSIHMFTYKIFSLFTNTVYMKQFNFDYKYYVLYTQFI